MFFACLGRLSHQETHTAPATSFRVARRRSLCASRRVLMRCLQQSPQPSLTRGGVRVQRCRLPMNAAGTPARERPCRPPPRPRAHARRPPAPAPRPIQAALPAIATTMTAATTSTTLFTANRPREVSARARPRSCALARARARRQDRACCAVDAATLSCGAPAAARTRSGGILPHQQ